MRRDLPPLNALRAFEIASQTASFTAAADELCVSQGAVSRHIARLEQHLGVILFERGSRQVRLTENGALLAGRLHIAFDQIEEATRGVDRARQRQRVRLGLFPTIATSWLMRRLPGFQANYPSIELQVTCKTDFAEDDRRRFDVVSGRGPVPTSSFEYQPVLDIVLRPVCNPMLLAGPEGLRVPEDLRRCTTLHSMNRRDDWAAWLDHAGLGPLESGRTLYFENSVLAHEAAAAGVGVAMAICAPDPATTAGRLVEPFPLGLTTGESYGLSWPKTSNRVPAVRAFRDWLTSELVDRCAA